MNKARRLLLPDEQHTIVIEDYGVKVYCYVISNHKLDRKQEFSVQKANAQWNDLVHQFCELARKKYPREIRHKSISVHRQRIGL